MESKWEYQLTQKASEDLVRKKTVGNYILYYLPDAVKQIIFVLRIVYGKRNMDEILRKLDL